MLAYPRRLARGRLSGLCESQRRWTSICNPEEKSCDSQDLILIQPMPVREGFGGHSFSSLHLDFEQFKRSSLAGRNQQSPLQRHQATRRAWHGFLDHSRLPNVKKLPAKMTISARPRQKTARAIDDLPRRPVPIHRAVFFLEDRRERCLRIVLRLSAQRSSLDLRQRLHQQIGVSHLSSMSPVSSPASMRIVVTPVTDSPFAMAHWIGAAPRYLGSNDP